jgi:Arf-GAP/Rho-GAP domain/ANK repeat/PH domain-containing protein 1
MSVPIPAPRQNQPPDLKKPVPTPRKAAPKVKPDSPDEQSNTFSRRVRSLSNASKQIAGDIGGLVQDKKKAVIEGTRQSVRRITKRFNSYHQEVPPGPESEPDDFSDTLDIFNSISFQSPLSCNSSIYNNVDDEFSAPPPAHPPPPLPQDVIYDAPPSVSGSTSNSEHSNVGSYQNYESVFPVYSNSDSDLSRSGSWKFYDPVSKVENIYNDVEIVKDESRSFDVNSNVSDLSIEIRNSLYENHTIVAKPRQEPEPKCRESVILQFDPLSRTQPPKEEEPPPTSCLAKEDIKLLEEFLQGDLYGNLSITKTLDDWSISNDSDPEDFITPPAPPVRFDSLPEEEQQPPQISPREKSRSHWFTSNESVKETASETKKTGWLKQLKGALEKAPEVVKGVRNRDSVVQRPELEVKSFVHKKGMLYKVQGGPVEDLFGEYSGRWCVLQNSNFICYADSTSESIKEHFPAESVLSIQILQDPKFKYKYDNDDLHCFELNTTGKSRGGHIYGTRDISERRVWMQCLAESLTKKFPVRITTDYTRMGWAYLREGVSGRWVGAWLMLSGRNLFYAVDNQSTKTMDLRKVRCMVLQMYQESDNNPRTNDKGPNIVVDTPNVTLYLRMWTSRETKVWCHIVKLAAHNNGAYLEQQQLTKDDIPVLVEKCINFIYTHGSMTEGIYRRPGTNTAVAEILAKFRKDSWAVQLTIDKHTEHDVATALKRFIRDLPEPVLTNNQRQYLHQVSKHNDRDDRIRMYKACLDQLPPISYKTAKKLLGHLHFVASQHKKNRMNVENLAAVWGPSLMHQEDKDNNSVTSTKHLQNTVVVRQLIEMYRDIFPEDPAEIEKEKLMLQVLEKYSKAPQGVVGNSKKAGDFRVWIYLHNKEGQPVNVAIGPNKTAYDVCVELSSKINMQVHDLILEEVVLNNKLQRPIHFSEKVLDIVLRWSYWDEPDRKDNHLVLLPIAKYSDFIQEKSTTLSAELKFSDSRSRNFKIFMFEFSQGKLNCFKDRSCEEKLFTYSMEEILWYFGHESKRNPQSKWTITFIERKMHPQRTKNCPYFGNVLVWNDPQTRAKWLGSMLKARYRDSLMQPAMHVNLMQN